MRIQFNLVPDVKQAYIKAQKTKKTVISLMLVATLISAGIFVLMLSIVYGVNKLQLSRADDSIKTNQQQLSKIQDLNKILTVQNQLQSLLSLNQSKNITSRMFDFIIQLTPASAGLSNLQSDFTTNTVQLTGNADSQKTINTFIDTLKFTTYKVDGTDSGKKAFTAVLESNFGVDQKGANFGISMQFDPALFTSKNVSLNIPAGLSTTRSVLDDPSNVLFNGQASSSGSSSNSTNGGGQ